MTTIKVSVQTRDRLKLLADEEHLTMDAALSRVLDKTEDARFWEGVRADYARLQAIQRNGRITSANWPNGTQQRVTDCPTNERTGASG